MSSSVLSCPFVASPPLNTDVAGIGVRISTYVQSLLTVVIITVLPEIGDIYAQCFPFVIMNISVMIAALLLGFSPDPQISLQDGLIAWLFTFIPLFVITLGTGMIKNRNKKKAVKSSPWDRLPMEWFSYIMLILHAAYTLSLLRNFKTFGSTPGCNKAARVFLFGTHKLTNAWFLGWTIAYAIILSGMFFLIFKPLFPMVSRKPITKPEEQKAAIKPQGNQPEESATPKADLLADYLWGFFTFTVMVIWIAFTEVTVVKNNFAPANGPIWQFGQIFPVILLAVPVLTAARAVSEIKQDAEERKEKTNDDKEGA